jgi:hypothetical protein
MKNLRNLEQVENIPIRMSDFSDRMSEEIIVPTFDSLKCKPRYIPIDSNTSDFNHSLIENIDNFIKYPFEEISNVSKYLTVITIR